jgi:hypothetical protein
MTLTDDGFHLETRPGFERGAGALGVEQFRDPGVAAFRRAQVEDASDDRRLGRVGNSPTVARCRL